MKTINLFLIVLSVFVFQMLGCGGSGDTGPHYTSIKQYESGTWEEGWFKSGMTADEVKTVIDGMTDSDAKKFALEMFKQRFENLSKEEYSSFKVGSILIVNSTSYDNVDVGVEGPENKKWTLGKKGSEFATELDMLVPGDYLQWWDDGSGKKYLYEKDEEGNTLYDSYGNPIYEIKTIGTIVEKFQKKSYSAVLNLKPKR